MRVRSRRTTKARQARCVATPASKANYTRLRPFFEAHPFGTVPAAFSPDGRVGIFESNSIMRAVARLGDAKLGLYGTDSYETSRIDSFLDASLVFARDSQIYLLALGSGSLSEEIYHRTREAFAVYMAGINSALVGRSRFHCRRPPDPGRRVLRG